MKNLKKGIIICFFSFFLITIVNAAGEKAEGIKSFSVECDKTVESEFYGVARMLMEVGEESSCTLILDHTAIGLSGSAGNKLLSNLRSLTDSAAIVSPEYGETDGNGKFSFTVIAKKKGSAWISWAVADKSGEFDFAKTAYKAGTAWGMFVIIK